MLALSMLIMQMLSQSGLTGASSGPLSLSSELAQEEPAVALRGSEQSNSESIPSWRVKLGLGPREVPVTGIFERERIESYVMDALDNCKKGQPITVIFAGCIIVMTLDASKHGICALPLDLIGHCTLPSLVVTLRFSRQVVFFPNCELLPGSGVHCCGLVTTFRAFRWFALCLG